MAFSSLPVRSRTCRVAWTRSEVRLRSTEHRPGVRVCVPPSGPASLSLAAPGTLHSDWGAKGVDPMLNVLALTAVFIPVIIHLFSLCD